MLISITKFWLFEVLQKTWTKNKGLRVGHGMGIFKSLEKITKYKGVGGHMPMDLVKVY